MRTLIMCCAACFAVTARTNDEPKPLDELAAINAASRAAYSAARTEALKRSGPVLHVMADVLVLHRGEKRSEQKTDHTRYELLKDFSHIALATHALLTFVDGPLSAEQRTAVTAYRETAGRALMLIDRLEPNLSEAQRGRQRQLVKQCLDFLDGVLRSGECKPSELTGFCRAVKPLVMANADEAAREELLVYHAAVQKWQEELTADEWKRLTVIISGGQLPRAGNLAVQYFARLLGEPGEGRRVVYAEAIWDETKAMNLLGSRLLDARIGTDFFDDERRMYRDLLADAARKAIPDILKNSKGKSQK